MHSLNSPQMSHRYIIELERSLVWLVDIVVYSFVVFVVGTRLIIWSLEKWTLQDILMLQRSMYFSCVNNILSQRYFWCGNTTRSFLFILILALALQFSFFLILLGVFLFFLLHFSAICSYQVELLLENLKCLHCLLCVPTFVAILKFVKWNKW